ncbi:MAG: response regulator, partial [Syntrophales bacterium]
MNGEHVEHSQPSSSQVCPITGRAVVRKPEWTNIRCGNNFRSTLYMLGDSIIVSRPSGSISPRSAKDKLLLYHRFISENLSPEQPYILMEDCSRIHGISLETIRSYINFVKKAGPRLAGLIFYGASLMLGIPVRLVARFYSRRNIRMARDYAHAVTTALNLLSRHGPPAEKQKEESAESRRDFPNITRNKGWFLRFDGLSIRYEIIDGDILHADISGSAEEIHMPAIAKMHETMTGFLDAPDGSAFVLVNMTDVSDVSFKARRYFINFMQQWYKEHPFRMFVLYGTNMSISAAINLSKGLVPFPVYNVSDFDTAMKLIRKEKTLIRKKSPVKIISSHTDKNEPASDRIRQYVNELLDYLGRINWEGSGFYDEPKIDPRHPFKPVFDAVSLIKSDMDLLFQERKTSEEELRESEEKFKSLSHNAPDIIYNLDVDGTFTYINPAWEVIMGHKRREVIGRHFHDFAEEGMREHVRNLLSIRDRGEIVRDMSITLLNKDGSPRLFNMSAAPNFNSNGILVGIVGLLKDITEHRKLEAQLQQAQKMEAIGTLAGGIAHDFNNLLMGIQGYVSLMLLDMDTGHPHYEMLKGVEQQVKSGADLTKQLLGFARAGKIQVKPTDLNELIKKTVSLFGRTKKEINIHVKLQKALWAVEADQIQIEQVLLNLYINAWQAMPAGGDLFIEAENAVLDEAHAALLDLRPGDYVRISVTDTGIGMDEKVRKRIFEPFFTTKEMGRGTGLGLASAYGIVKGHGGIINVYSEKGHGSTFRIYLPASSKEIAGETGISEELLRGSETILLVDDEETILRVTAEILRKLGYHVLICHSGREAIRMYESRGSGIDLVILDMIMPDLGGRETFEKLKEIDARVRVILSSGYSLNDQATRIMELGCNAFIQKPFNMRELSQKVREVLD